MPAAETVVLFTRDGEEVLRRQLAPGAYVIGRWHESDLHVIGDLVSRQHARLVVEEGQVFLEDLGSSNGTFINGAAITGLTVLPPGVRAQLGVREHAGEPGALTLEIPYERESAAPSAALAQVLPDEFFRGKKYDVGPMIAQGGMGAILDAREATIRRSVAMKVMLTEGEPDDLRRFIEEAQITGQLEHPNIVPVHELGLDAEGKLFYTMKLVKGITLLKILQLLGTGVGETARKYPLAELLTVFQKVCDAIAFAHSKGVLHRDLKPENVMIARYGEVLVMDWGIAKLVQPVGAAKDSVARREVDVKSTFIKLPRGQGNPAATMNGAIMGTPGFMSPEQTRGEVDALDARSDVFALGAILYTILTLEFPFDGATAEEIVEKVKTTQPIPPTQRVLGTRKGGGATAKSAPPKAAKGQPHLPGGRVPEALNAITMKALAMRREDRYQTVEELQADIAAFQGGFATSAEHAGVGRQLWLLVQRNKALAACAAIFFLLVNAFGVTVLISQRQMTAALAQLRGTAPTFQAQAQNLVNEGKLDDALDKIAFAIQLEPASADYHLFRANTLEAAQKLGEAATEYRRVLVLRRGDEAAQKNLALCTQLLADNGGDGPLKREIQVRLADQLNAQRRSVEAGPLVAILGKVSGDAAPAIRARIKEYTVQGGWNDSRLTASRTGGFALDLSRLQVTDLGKLQGLPIDELKLDYAIIDTLAGVEKLNLTALNIGNTKVTDLAPLRGLKLRRLDLDNTKVIDLAPLTGMPLESLSMNSVRATDLSPLRGAPLRSVHASNTPVADLTFLATAEIESLYLNDTRITDLAPLQGKKLRLLSIVNCPGIFDLTPLKTLAALEELHLPAQAIDCAALRDLPKLRRIRMDDRAPDLLPAATFWAEIFPTFDKAGPLRTALQRACPKVLPPHAVEQTADGKFFLIDLHGITPRDLKALSGQPVRELRANGTSVWDLGLLAGAPLTVIHLQNSGFLDCRQLTEFPSLEEIILPANPNYLESLRKLPKLKYLGHEWNAETKHASLTAEEFWAAWEAKKK